jgi:hypothetical protein
MFVTGADEHANDRNGRGVVELAQKALFRSEMKALGNMGFEDGHRNLMSLVRTGGDIDTAVVRLLRE